MIPVLVLGTAILIGNGCVAPLFVWIIRSWSLDMVEVVVVPLVLQEGCWFCCFTFIKLVVEEVDGRFLKLSVDKDPSSSSDVVSGASK